MMKMPAAPKEFLEDFISLIFPRVCVHCSTVLVHQEQHLCTKCRLALPKTDYHQIQGNFQQQKFVFEPKVKGVASYLHLHKGGIAQSLIYELKYRSNLEIGEMIGRWYGLELKEAGWQPDIIIPVPLHAAKLKKRGYNQSACFGTGLAEGMNVPLNTEIVVRIRKTGTQTKKTKVERWQNIDSAYAVKDPAVIIDKAVLIVDDVLTTGATIGDLATLLSDTGAKEIFIATIAAGR